jgi:hypothetical protein
MSPDVPALQLAAAHWVFAAAELYTLPELAASHQAFLAVVSAPMVTHVALQHAVMSADVSELQAAAAHGLLAAAELYTLPVAPAPVLQKLSGADGGDGAMVEHWALAVQHVLASAAFAQVNPAQSVLAAPGL